MGNTRTHGDVTPDANSPVWSRDVRAYTRLDSWTDPGERAVVALVADEVRGRPLLDVGVGAGRSSWFLRLISAEYTGIDYTPEMVDHARAARSDARFEVADARDLSGFAEGTFALVFFSHAGLDSLSHDGRRQALAEFARVLAPGGLLVYSTLNRRGSFFGCGPGPVGPVGRPPQPYHVLRFAARAALHPGSHVRGFANVRRMRGEFVDKGDWALHTMPTHDWSLLVHYVTAEEARREVVEAGLRPVRTITREGRDMTPADPTAWFHVVARKDPGERP